jgi:DNA-binding IclR family transcriptional regulator
MQSPKSSKAPLQAEANIEVEPAGRAAAGEKAGPLSMERIFGVLFSVSSDPRGKSLTELSLELRTPKTSLLNLLPGLVKLGYLVRGGHNYHPGPTAFRLATAISRARETIATVAQPLLRRLAEDTGKTVTLCVLAPDERAILHIAKEESRSAMRFSVEVGDRAPLHTTAGGRVILAFRPGEWAENFLRNAALTRQTDRTIADRDALRASVEKVRKLGYAVTRGETYENVGAVSAPVFGGEGFLCAIVVAGAVEQVIAKAQTLASLARSTADEISVLMGQRGGASL